MILSGKQKKRVTVIVYVALFTIFFVMTCLTPMLAEYGMPLEEGAIVSNNNLFWNTKGDVTYSTQANLTTLNAAQTAGMEEGSLTADPCFADPENNDFTLPADSPAYKIGFVPFDYTVCGPRTRK